MKKTMQNFLLMGICLVFVILLFPSYGAPMQAIELGEEAEVTFYGFLRNNLGMFMEEQPFAQSGNDLATARTWLRAYMDLKASDKIRLWAACQFVYEPEYDMEKNAQSSLTPAQRGDGTKGWKEYSEYKNINDILREAFLEWKASRDSSIRIGRQIVIWGEALTTRVGDVVHPDDTRFTFAFANLEDTRVPSWMVRGLHDIPSINSSFEWIYNPNIVGKKYTVSRSSNFPVALANIPGQRFGIHPETRFRPPISVGNPPLLGSNAVQFHPLSRDWVNLPGLGWIPTTLPALKEEYPSGWTKDARGGFRTNTMLEGYSFGLSYFHTQNYDPVIKVGNLTGAIDTSTGFALPIKEYILVHPDIDIFGVYMNKDLTGIPGVLRTEAIYIPNKPYVTFDLSDSDAVVRRDYLKYLIGYDLSGYLYFDWHNTASFDITFEHVGEWIPDNEDLQYIVYATEMRTWNPSFGMRISTNWLYNKISTDLIVNYTPWGKSGLIMPTVTYKPAWVNEQLSFELKYIGIFAENHSEGLGILQKKDMIVLTTQFSW